MNFRKRLASEPIGFQLAPMIDVIMFLLCFFLLTWNITRYESDLEVKVPAAKNGTEPKRLPGEVILNIRADGTVTLNRRSVDETELKQVLGGIVKQYPDQAAVIRADENAPYRHVVRVLDICRGVDLWNINFATSKPEESTAR
jgi:biopolymer transport protein ExbD